MRSDDSIRSALYKGYRMKITASLLTVFCFLAVYLFPTSSFGEKPKPIEAGMKLPHFVLPAPETPDDRQYLELTSSEPFSISQIPAKLVLVEVFHVLCHHCQKQAPEMNRIFQYIKEDPELAQSIKMLGIGISSDQKALDAFEKSFHGKFPLIPDQKLTVFSLLGEPPIPFLMLVDNQGNVLLTNVGYLNDTDDFFRRIKQLHKKIQ